MGFCYFADYLILSYLSWESDSLILILSVFVFVRVTWYKKPTNFANLLNGLLKR